MEPLRASGSLQIQPVIKRRHSVINQGIRVGGGVGSTNDKAHHVHAFGAPVAASGSLAVNGFLLLKRVWPVNLPRRFDVDAEVVLSPLGRFSYDLDELRIESEQRKIVRIADDCFDVCSSHSTAALSKAHCVPQDIGHDVVEQPCGEVASDAEMVARIVLHQRADKPQQRLILTDVAVQQGHGAFDGDRGTPS